MPEQFSAPLDLIGQTTLGALLVISIIAIWYLYKQNQEIQEKRIQDLKDINNVINSPLNSIKQTVENILSLLTKK